MLAFDTETRGLLYREGHGSVFMVQWADAEREYVCTEDTGWHAFLHAIAQDDMLVAANASFDIHHLRASGIVDLLTSGHRVHDVQTLARVVMPGRFSYKLESLGKDLLGADATEQQRALQAAAREHDVPWTTENKDYHKLWRAAPAVMGRYGCEDVRLTYDLFNLIWSRATPADIEVYRMEIAEVAPILRAMERDGVLVDQVRLADLKRRIEAERDTHYAALLAAGFTPASLGTANSKGSTVKLREELLAIGVKLTALTKTGQLAVNKDALMAQAEDFPVVKTLLAWRSANKTLQTYVRPLEAADPRVHTSIWQVEARTSRMSSSQPNMQNLPTTTGIRDVLIPEPGCAFASADLSSIEVYMMAYYINNPELIAALEAGYDLYSMNAATVNNVPYETCVKGGSNEKLRKRSKIAVLSLMYGAGAARLSRTLGIPFEEAERLKHDTLAAIPGFNTWSRTVAATVKARGSKPYVETILGRRLAIPRLKLRDEDGNIISEKTAAHVAVNTIIQGSAAEIMKLCLIKATPVIAEYDYRPVLVVHDELLAEGPAACAPAALGAMITAMESAYPLTPALKADGKWSTDSYGACKD